MSCANNNLDIGPCVKTLCLCAQKGPLSYWQVFRMAWACNQPAEMRACMSSCMYRSARVESNFYICKGGEQGRTCSLPQSYWIRRRSGKKSCWRTMAVRNEAERANTSACNAAARAAASATVLGSGRLHQTSGGGARACMSATHLSLQVSRSTHPSYSIVLQHTHMLCSHTCLWMFMCHVHS